MPGFQLAAVQAFRLLTDVGASILAGLAQHLEAPCDSLMTLVESDVDLVEGISASVLRICSYSWTEDEQDEVAFGDHTDTSFLTVAPVSAVAGLEIQLPDGSWCCPEQGLEENDIVVFVGDFLQVVLDKKIAAAVHRVRRPPTDRRPRMSSPLLMRCSPEGVLHPGVPGLLQVERPLSMQDLQQFCDMKRKKLAQKQTSNDWVLRTFE
mmetsp:Transcript_68272/g.156768  ORF Transcript_68272/g.156768 Transcript_68272/m.156768 type:complete len:208 (-) Transcript_68272:11-634(-)